MSSDVSEPPVDVCGFTPKPKDIGQKIEDSPYIDDIMDWYDGREIATCIREPWKNHDACIWHAEVEDKPADVLVTAWAEGHEGLDGAYLANVDLGNRISFSGCRIWGANLSGADLTEANLSDADLRGADISEAVLKLVDLSEAKLSRADLSGADLSRADLSGADLSHAKLPKADLSLADLSGAVLTWADMTEAYLRNANLSETHLQSTVLAGVILGLENTDLSSVKLDHKTRFAPRSLRLRIKTIFGLRLRKILFDSDALIAHSRDAHKLAVICSEKGLTKQARTLTIWDRHARRRATLSNRNLLTAFGSWLNWQATGYGLSVGRVSRNMLFLFIASTLTYLLYGIQTADEAISFLDLVSTPFPTESVVNAFYFSIITFTTAPPWNVSVGVSQGVAMVETFLGTLLIVLLGYVLGNRERI